MGGCEKVLLINIAILAENVSATSQAILVRYSIGNTAGDTMEVSPILAISILILRY